MRLLSFRSDDGQIHVGVLRDSNVIDLTIWLSRHRSRVAIDMLQLIHMGEQGLAYVKAALDTSSDDLGVEGALVPLDLDNLTAPIPRPAKNIFCLGRNYAEHAAESRFAFGENPQASGKAPQYPTIFTKSPTTVLGPYESIPFDPAVMGSLDWEAELALVIGKAGKNIKREDAMPYVFGYTVLNDLSARDIQGRHGGQFFKGKSLDGTCPMGPWIVTPDEIGDPNRLEIFTRVNGLEKQHDNTGSMLLDVVTILEALSLGMTLEPGDIVATGTPAGVGHARTPPEFLRPGDTVECEIEKIGAIKNIVREIEA
ncbi:MAG: fumarylacetoacetate hydrolase family protein [Chloroflexota bacterium]|nr:fumarylacetoacetate hydrolase family protein [Chloroflexota bacterium]